MHQDQHRPPLSSDPDGHDTKNKERIQEKIQQEIEPSRIFVARKNSDKRNVERTLN